MIAVDCHRDSPYSVALRHFLSSILLKNINYENIRIEIMQNKLQFKTFNNSQHILSTYYNALILEISKQKRNLKKFIN